MVAYTINDMKNTDTSQGCTNLKLRKLTRMVTRHYDHYVATCGLKNTQYALLSYAVKLEPVRPVDLARHMQMDASTLTRNMQPLVAQGWLKMCAGNDARSRRIEVTAAGREKQAQAQRVWQEAQVAIVAQLGAERVAALHQLLEECIDCLDGSGEGVTEPPHHCP